jgi:hypothetical protein
LLISIGYVNRQNLSRDQPRLPAKAALRCVDRLSGGERNPASIRCGTDLSRFGHPDRPNAARSIFTLREAEVLKSLEQRVLCRRFENVDGPPVPFCQSAVTHDRSMLNPS